jgi:hypothetical protein
MIYRLYQTDVLKQRRNKRSAYTGRPIPPLVEEKATLLNTYMCRREQKFWPWIWTRPEAKNNCAGEGQQQFNRDRPTNFIVVQGSVTNYI